MTDNKVRLFTRLLESMDTSVDAALTCYPDEFTWPRQQVADDLLLLAIRHIRNASPHRVAELKRLMADYNATTGTWKEKP